MTSPLSLRASELQVGDVIASGPWEGWRVARRYPHTDTISHIGAVVLLTIETHSTWESTGETVTTSARRIWLRADEEVEVSRCS